MALQRFTDFSAGISVTAVASRVKAIQILRADTPGADTFLQIYNKATAPTLGTDVPELVVRVPQAAQAGLARMQKVVLPGGGIRCPLGIGLGVVTTFNGATGATTTAPQAADVAYEIGG